jgi:hypothetical protein
VKAEPVDNGSEAYACYSHSIFHVRSRILCGIRSARVALVPASRAPPDVFTILGQITCHHVRASAPSVLSVAPRVSWQLEAAVGMVARWWINNRSRCCLLNVWTERMRRLSDRNAKSLLSARIDGKEKTIPKKGPFFNQSPCSRIL